MSLALAQNYLKTFPFKVNNLSRVFFQPAAADNKLLGGASSGMERNGTEQKTNFPSMTVDIYADLFVMTPLSAVAPAVGHLLSHSLPSVCSIRLSFPPPPFSFIHAQRPLINALAKKAAHLFVVLPSAWCWRRNFYNEKLSAHKMKSRRWQLTGRESCLPPVPSPASPTASSMGWTVNFKALANFHLSCPPYIVVASKHNESAAHRSFQYTQLGR